MLTIIAIVVGVPVAIVLVLAATKPDSFRMERSATIDAPPERIFPMLNDFRRWGEWSPWEKLDPAMRRTFGGPEPGVGSTYEWEGNSKAGKGRMQITESQPSSRVVLDLDFIKPFKSHNVTQFDLAPNGAATNITWSMHGPNTFMTKVMTVFTSMDKLVGKDFDQGLLNLQAAATDSSAASR